MAKKWTPFLAKKGVPLKSPFWRFWVSWSGLTPKVTEPDEITQVKKCTSVFAPKMLKKWSKNDDILSAKTTVPQLKSWCFGWPFSEVQSGNHKWPKRGSTNVQETPKWHFWRSLLDHLLRGSWPGSIWIRGLFGQKAQKGGPEMTPKWVILGHFLTPFWVIMGHVIWPICPKSPDFGYRVLARMVKKEGPKMTWGMVLGHPKWLIFGSFWVNYGIFKGSIWPKTRK